MSRSGYQTWLLTWLLFIVICSLQTASATHAAGEFIPASSDNCACPNQIQTYTCTVVGGGSTIWTGTALSTCNENEIILLHSEFGDHTAVETCNNGAIIGQGLRENNNRYTSELRVNASTGLNNTAVRCLNAELATVGEASINVISGAFDTRLQQPTVVSSMAGVLQLNFTWTVVNLNCTSVASYQITASGCGNCSVATETTTALCSGLQVPAVCRFSVRSVVCGEIGMPSNEVTVSVRVPEQPQVTITPVYTAAMQLVRLNLAIINRQNSTDNSGSVLEAVTNYSISYGDTATSTFARNTSCIKDACVYMLDVPSEVCSSLDHADVTLSASNVFGVGSSSNISTVGCTNRFVHVEYNQDSSEITCTFLSEDDTSIKSCTVMYGRCNQEIVNTVQRNSTEETLNRITLQVNGNIFECYTVTASSAISSVIVEGGKDLDSNHFNIVAAVVPIVMITGIVFIITVMVIVIYLKVYRQKCQKGRQQRCNDVRFDIADVDDHPCIGQLRVQSRDDHASVDTQCRVTIIL